jgi:CheY-like chemotaxis protein
LGLNLCKKLCNAMEGDIEFSSEVNIKTTFTFWIPIETSVEFSGNEIQEEIALGGKNIKKGSVVLNVDDDPLNIYIMNNYAAKLEVKCCSYSHPLEAVEKISKLDLDIGVAFLDLNMPEMSGYETAMKLKQLLPDLVLIAVTGSDTSDVAVQCKSAGFDEILEKPLTFIKYSVYINKYIKTA